MPQGHLCPRPFSNSRPDNRRMRAPSATVLHWRTSPHAGQTARVKRDVAGQKYSRETECLGETCRLVCNTAHAGARGPSEGPDGTIRKVHGRQAVLAALLPAFDDFSLGVCAVLERVKLSQYI
jgi:hypothetical protein